MTNNDAADDKKPGKEQRPHATLNLTAEEIPTKTETAQAAAGDPQPAPAAEDWQRLEGGATPPEADPPPFPGGVSLSGIATHMAAGAAGAMLALILGYFLFWGPEPVGLSPEEAQALRAQIGSAENKLAALEADLRKTAERAEQGQAASGESEGLKQDVAGLAERLASLEARPAGGGATPEAVQQSLDPVNVKLANLEQRLESMSKTQSDMRTDGKATALALALYNLRRATNEGRPFAAELKSVADMSPVPLDLAALDTRRDQGVPSLDQLKAGFEAAASAALVAENQPAGDSFASELWSKAKSFVRVRRKGDVPGNDTSAILARVEHQLERENLRAALSEAGQLSGPAADAMAPWLETLKSKIAADEALAQVEAKLLTALGGGDSGKRGG
jgi:hypothetical protein